jgi:lipopolysaccharide transport system permease protein
MTRGSAGATSRQQALDGVQTVRIRPSRGWAALNLRDLWQYRELIYFLIWRDIKVRYKQTLLGATWAILQPLLTAAIFSLVFGRLAKIPSDGIPYPLFSYTALVPWTFFATGMTQSANSLVNSAHLITKIYFPRLAMPIATVLAGLLDFSLAFVILVVMMLYYQRVPTINVVWLPLFLLLALVTALGVGMWLAALNVQFRDVKYAVPFLSQIWLFATPIAYSSSLLSGPWRAVYALNPMVGVVEGFRWALLGAQSSPGPILLVSTITALLVLVTGTFYFRRTEKTFADVI